MNYSDLPLEAKLAQIAECRLTERQLPFAEEYAQALVAGNDAVIAECESFGPSARKIIQNREDYAQGLSAFGFTEIRFNEYG
jgi:hypothetical protein